ncbi:MAG: T9SS type B sorting domain-containing protein [Flavobacterium sp.]|uniref:T9SS type B sorting domain-containing protein n=1 Tax=Flavobacterium sp. TaxID=239 RepID=UPI00352787BE
MAATIKTISPASPGWDANLQRTAVPATDYWFRVDYLEQGVMKQFRAHFVETISNTN